MQRLSVHMPCLLFLLVLFFLGAVAGMLNVWRVFTGRGLAAGYFDEQKNSSDKYE